MICKVSVLGVKVVGAFVFFGYIDLIESNNHTLYGPFIPVLRHKLFYFPVSQDRVFPVWISISEAFDRHLAVGWLSESGSWFMAPLAWQSRNRRTCSDDALCNSSPNQNPR